MIYIKKSATADSRTCDFSKVTKEQLLKSSKQHRGDVAKGLEYFAGKLVDQAYQHDHDKLSDIDGFHAEFITDFETTKWWDNHRKVNRHHLLQEDGVPEDVNLIDVLDFITDCVMAGMGRNGTVYPIEISPEVLMDAFNNTVEALKANVVVEEDQCTPGTTSTFCALYSSGISTLLDGE